MLGELVTFNLFQNISNWSSISLSVIAFIWSLSYHGVWLPAFHIILVGMMFFGMGSILCVFTIIWFPIYYLCAVHWYFMMLDLDPEYSSAMATLSAASTNVTASSATNSSTVTTSTVVYSTTVTLFEFFLVAFHYIVVFWAVTSIMGATIGPSYNILLGRLVLVTGTSIQQHIWVVNAKRVCKYWLHSLDKCTSCWVHYEGILICHGNNSLEYTHKSFFKQSCAHSINIQVKDIGQHPVMAL